MAKKILIIGDIHGRKNWQDISNLDSYDQIVVMGDYFDPYDGNISYDDRLKNFEKLVALKQTNPAKWVLLFGNHDLHYLPSVGRDGSRYDEWFKANTDISNRLENLVKEGTLEIAYSIDSVFFIHAGISVKWYNQHILGKSWQELQEAPELGIKKEDIVSLEVKLDEIFLKMPKVFTFGDSPFDTYGYDPTQGPLWWRALDPYSMVPAIQEGQALVGIIQVNGHTQVRELTRLKDHNGADVVFVDGLGSGWYTELTIQDDGSCEFKQKSIY